MEWDGNRESDNVEDRRGEGGGGGFPIGGGTLGIGTVVVAVVASYFLGISPGTILSLLGGGGSAPVSAPSHAPANDQTTRFVRTVLADTEDTWSALFSARGAQYRPPTLVLFTGSTPTACGTGQTATGPFYCPGDQKVYIDLSFYQDLRDRFHAPGDFAQAYVIAHEVGHHVQNLTGIMEKVDSVRRHASQVQANAISVRLELQADCFAGVWGHHSRIKLDPGDVDEALHAANAIGDDTLQRETQGTVVPDSFTHGTSAQRAHWFKRGFDSGRMTDCNTFADGAL
ncbi:MAG: KPN_02809 family neutral zinc metallopeptidase [Burkholderiaceae bacterium]